ncbi:MAG: hypothetical protein M9894_00715 [Planctomycetes bacterium]|nr:hypothetical protein [Planctomycetota bacterium]
MNTTDMIQTQLVTILLLGAFVLFLANRISPGGRLGAWILRATLHALGACLSAPLDLLRSVGALWGDQGRTLHCSLGCGRRFPGVGVTTCSACGYRSRRSFFSPCPCCALTRRHVRCPHCRTSVLRPAFWTQPSSPRHYR